MSSTDPRQPDPRPPAPRPKEEHLLVRGVLGSWSVQGIAIITGFVLPPLIDRSVGQARLGVWDFGWTFVAYLALLQGGMNSSIARYVARYAGLEAWGELSDFLKTGLVAFLMASSLALLVTLGTIALLPVLFAETIGEHMAEARTIVLVFGIAVCIQFPQAVFGGVIAGRRRYDLLNGVLAGGHLLQMTGIAVAVWLWKDLGLAACAVVIGDLAMFVAKTALAYRLCPEIAITRAHITRAALRDIVVFGGKTQLSGLSKLALYQTSSMLVMGYLGPAALALYARPRSLVLHVQKILRRMAMVMEPSAASLEAEGRQDALRRLYLEGTRFAAYIAVPLLLMLVLMGDPLMGLWMGLDYRNSLLIAVLAVGHFPTLVQRVTFSILLGLGRHGFVALMDLVAGVASVGLTILFLGVFHWGVVSAALALVAPMAVVNTFVVPVIGCRLIGVSVADYVRRALVPPVVASIPFAGVLVAARLLFPYSQVAELVVGLAAGGAWMVVWYWHRVLPASLKSRVRRMIGAV